MKKALSERAFEKMLSYSDDMIFLKDKNLIYIAASEPFVKMVGKKSAEDIIGHSDFEIFDDIHLANRYVADDHKIIASQNDLLNFVEPITDVNGHSRYGSTSKYLLRNDEGEIIGLLGITRDVTMEYMARQRYEQELSYLFTLPEDTYAVCYIDIDDWRVIKQIRQNISEGTLQECETVEEICRCAVESIVNKNDMAVEFYQEFTADNIRGFYHSGRNDIMFEYERKLSNGLTKWVRNEIHFLVDTENGHLCVMLSAKDIDEAKRNEQKLINAAKLDGMTGVLNRETAMDYIRYVLECERDKLHALMMLDLDNFKGINDTYGHQTGDEFLIKLASGLKKSFCDSDVVGRIGGDEFFIFLRNIPEIKMIENKAESVLKIVGEISDEYDNVSVSGSIGVSLYPDNGKNIKELYKNADKALYEAKNSGKNKYIFVG